MGRKKDKKKKEEVVVEEPMPEPAPEPIPEPTPEPPKPQPVIPDDKNFVWKAVELESKEQIIDLFNGIEAAGFEITEYDFEFNFRRGVVDVIYKVKR